MGHLVKALGFWIWGLIAIGLAASVASVSFRVLALNRHDELATSSLTAPELMAGSSTPSYPSSAGIALPSASHPALPGSYISRAIGKPIRAAELAMHAEQWAEVIRCAQAAEATSGLTPIDRRSINELKGYAYIKLRMYAEAQLAYEAAMAAGVYSPEEAARINKLLFQLAAQNRQIPQALEYGESAADQGSASPDDLLIISQLYYQQRDCGNAPAWGDKAASAYQQVNDTPKEVLFQIRLQCASDIRDSRGMIGALYELVRVTNKTQYWNQLIRLERQDTRDEHDLLMMYRVMYATNSMNSDSDYIEMAQLLGDSGLPGEAATVLTRALKTGTVREEHRERTQRLLQALQARAIADRTDLEQEALQARQSGSGEPGVRLGEYQYGFGDDAAAAAWLSIGIEKGGLMYPDDAFVYLGPAQAALLQTDEARQSFTALQSLRGINPQTVGLWRRFAETRLPGPPLASARLAN